LLDIKWRKNGEQVQAAIGDAVGKVLEALSKL
jgi:hypothetical protein